MRCMQRFLIPWVSLWFASTTTAQSVHISHCLGECPQVSRPDTEIVVRHLYAAAINPDTALAEWVAYRVLPDSVGVASLLPRFWQEDSLVKTGAVNLELEDGPDLVQPDLSDAQDREYRINETRFNAGDQGRLTPMTSFAGTPYWDELNYLSNMSPIPPSLRLGSWSRLDQAINELAVSSGEVFVISGPLHSYMANNGDSVLPNAYFKIITDGDTMATFVFPADTPIHARYCDQLATLSQVESQLDRQIFPGLNVQEQGIMAQALECE